MKKANIIIGALIALQTIVAAVFISFMPDEVPVHVGFSGGIDRMGSRYENFVMPILALVFGGLLFLAARYGEASNRRLMVKLNAGFQLFMLAFSIFWFSNTLAANDVETSYMFGWTVTKFVVLISGAICIFLGNMLPKLNRNSVAGVRTSWSISSEEVWRKTQRFSGYAFIAAGLVVVALGLLLDGTLSILVLLTIIIICSVACVVASYVFYRRTII